MGLQDVLNRISQYDDEQLDRELVFARNLSVPGPEAEKWLDALEDERAERDHQEELSEASAAVADGLRKLYEACNDDEAAVGEYLYEIDKAVRSDR